MKSHIKYNNSYQEDMSFILGLSYGSEGVMPMINGIDGCCVSSSGDSLCGCYMGHKNIMIDGEEFYIVQCDGFDCKLQIRS